jgi:hypothetical protein
VNLTPYGMGWVRSVRDCPPCGTPHPRQARLNLPSVCRPTRRISDQTPAVLARSLTRAQVRKAVALKKLGRVIRWDSL